MKPMEVRLVGRFRFQGKLNGEHQTLMYRAVHCQTNERLILKGEEIKTMKTKKGCLSLLQQGKIYQSMQGGIGIPFMYWCGQEQDYNFIVIEELEATLEKLLNQCGGKFSLKTAVMMGIDLISILQYFHFKYFVYNNLHPKHIMTGKAQKYGKFFLVDFSKASRYRDSTSLEHITDSTDKNFQIKNYNMQFSSINYHQGGTTSRKDDMESLLYLILFMIQGELPWSSQIRSMKKIDNEKSRHVLELKLSVQSRLFNDYPQLKTLYNYTLSLKFQEKPQYTYYTSIFSQILQKHQQIDDKIYDWMLLQDQQPAEELTHKFNIFQNEEQFLQKVKEEKSSLDNLPNSKSIKILEKTSHISKNDKQCIIY